MGTLRDKRIVQSRIWLDPNQTPIPLYDYDYSYPITVYEAVKRSMDDTSTNLQEELDSIYRVINGKQDLIDPGVPGQIMVWTGMRGQIGGIEVVKTVNPDPAIRSHQKLASERAIGDALDSKVTISEFNTHASNNAIHTSDIERTRWNSMAPLSTVQAHIGNIGVHISETERGKWNGKANQTDLESHVFNTNNPHGTTAHQVGTYTRREIDDMFENLHESFFNYLNIQWDDRTSMAELIEYRPENWNPNYILEFKDTLPDITDPALTYFALKPATDYQINETQDCLIYVKRPGLTWQEVGFQSMGVGDMIIRFPDTSMFVWVQGRFLKLFTGNSGEDTPGGGGEGTSDMLWRPTVSAEGILTWVRSKETNSPGPVIIKGTDGRTPVKGVDYVDGKDGKGVPVGGRPGEVLVKNTDENYDTTWKTMLDALGDIIIGGGTLPEGAILWNNITGRPQWYNELGDNEDGFITQKAATRQFEVLNNNITQVIESVSGPGGLESLKQDIFDHINDFNNPHRITSAMIGAVSTSVFTDHVQNSNNPHNATANQIGLGNVNNTSDLNKPISNAVREALEDILDKMGDVTGNVDRFNFINNVTWNNTGATLTFIYRDGKELSIAIPIADIFNTIYFDDVDKELVIVLPDGTEHRIDIASLIQTYFGSISDNIQVVIEGNNVIKATVLPGTIGELEIAPSVRLRSSPTTTTQPVSDKSTRIATTEFVRGQVIDNLISYETDRGLSANMGRILNQKKADIEDVIDIVNDLEGIDVIDTLDSTNSQAALSANMGRHLDLTKAPRVHTSPSGSTFGRATISLFGHTRASDVDPLMDGTVFRGTDDGYYARSDHRHPTDVTRAPIHFPDITHNQTSFTGEPRSTLPPDDSNDDRIATTGWIRRNAVGVSGGECITSGYDPEKLVKLRSDFMADPVFLRQTGSTVAVTFAEDDISPTTVYMNVHGTGAALIIYGGMPITNGMIKANYTHFFTFDGTNWIIINPVGIHTLPDDDNSNAHVSSEWVRRNLVGVSKGESHTSTGNANKTATLQSTFMDPVVFMRQIGTTVAIAFDAEDRSGDTPSTLNVQESGASTIKYGGINLKNGMIGKKHTHMFVFDGAYWQLINPVPGTGMGGDDGVIIGPGGKPDAPEEGDDTVVNRQSGHNGFTTQGDGPVDLDGQVNRVWFAVNFSPRQSDVEVSFSDHEAAFSLRVGDGTSIVIRDPLIIDVTRSNCVAQFTLDAPYPANSPCQLIYRTNNAWINIKEI